MQKLCLNLFIYPIQFSSNVLPFLGNIQSQDEDLLNEAIIMCLIFHLDVLFTILTTLLNINNIRNIKGH